jgi:hypothetical protein
MYNVLHLCEKSVKKYKRYFLLFQIYKNFTIFAVNKMNCYGK